MLMHEITYITLQTKQASARFPLRINHPDSRIDRPFHIGLEVRSRSTQRLFHTGHQLTVSAVKDNGEQLAQQPLHLFRHALFA